MEANELRIGNYVSNEKGALTVIDGRSIFDLWSKTGILKHIPIPINEEWLLKFGFKVYDRMGDSIFLSFYDGKNHGWNVHLYYMDCLIGFNGLDWEKSFEIKHVHELQNLYFALTGGELKINEK